MINADAFMYDFKFVWQLYLSHIYSTAAVRWP